MIFVLGKEDIKPILQKLLGIQNDSIDISSDIQEGKNRLNISIDEKTLLDILNHTGTLSRIGQPTGIQLIKSPDPNYFCAVHINLLPMQETALQQTDEPANIPPSETIKSNNKKKSRKIKDPATGEELIIQEGEV